MIRRLSILISVILLSAISSIAQTGYTNVTAVVADGNGTKYVNAPYVVTFFDPGTSGKLPLLSGSTFQKSYNGYATDGSGNLNITLPDNSIIASSSGATGTMWVFSICTAVGAFTTQFCIPATSITISGASQNISAILTSVAPILPTQSGIINTLVNQVGVGAGAGVLAGFPGFQYGFPFVGAINLSTSTLGVVGTEGAVIALVNTNTPGLITYIGKSSTGGWFLNNDGATTPTHGYLGLDGTGQVTILGGNNGASMFMNTSAGTLPAGSVDFEMPDTGVGTALMTYNHPGNASEASKTWDTGTGCDKLYPINSSSVFTITCPPSSGTATTELVPNAGTTALNTGVLGAAGCEATITVSAPNVTTATRIHWNFATDPSAVAGYGAAPIAAVIISAWPTTGNVNFKQCSSVAVTPGAISILWNALD